MGGLKANVNVLTGEIAWEESFDDRKCNLKMDFEVSFSGNQKNDPSVEDLFNKFWEGKQPCMIEEEEEKEEEDPEITEEPDDSNTVDESTKTESETKPKEEEEEEDSEEEEEEVIRTPRKISKVTYPLHHTQKQTKRNKKHTVHRC